MFSDREEKFCGNGRQCATLKGIVGALQSGTLTAALGVALGRGHGICSVGVGETETELSRPLSVTFAILFLLHDAISSSL